MRACVVRACVRVLVRMHVCMHIMDTGVPSVLVHHHALAVPVGLL